MTESISIEFGKKKKKLLDTTFSDYFFPGKVCQNMALFGKV